MTRNRLRVLFAGLAGIGLCITAASATVPDKKQEFALPEPIPAPADNPLTPAAVELGKHLFFDPRLSGSGWISCASCHNPALGWSDGLPTAIGNAMTRLPRATPTIVNVAYNSIHMWDGRAKTLEAQATGPITAKAEMDMDMKVLVEKLQAIPGYRDLFERAYAGEGISDRTIAKALASFQRTVVSRNAPFDRWLAGDERAISDAAKRGFELFVGKAKCDACHQGPNFTDNGFHNIGLKRPPGAKPDPGRYSERKVARMKGAFKTPTLRDVALTGPYMHNGLYDTLEKVVAHYDRGGDVKENLDPNMEPLRLADREKADLVEFMKSLTGETVVVTIPQLPQ